MKIHEILDVLRAEPWNIETTHQSISNIRRTAGVPRTQLRHSDLIPWEIRPQDRHKMPAVCLRLYGRRRAELPLGEDPAQQERAGKMLDSWLAKLDKDQIVVDYGPDGWRYVHRLPTDTDVIRRPS